MADEEINKKEEVVEAEIIETTDQKSAEVEMDDGSEVVVEEQAQQPDSSSQQEEEPVASPDPVPETTVNIVIPPIAEETSDVEGIEVAKKELTQIHGEGVPKEEKPAEEKKEDMPLVAPEETITTDIPKKPISDGNKKPYTIRSEETGDKVYIVVNEKRYWIKNPETLKKLGFNLVGETKIEFNELLKFPEGKPVDLTVPGAGNPWDEPEEELPSGDMGNVWN